MEYMGVVVTRYILLIPTPLGYICSFLQQHPYFCLFLECF